MMSGSRLWSSPLISYCFFRGGDLSCHNPTALSEYFAALVAGESGVGRQIQSAQHVLWIARAYIPRLVCFVGIWYEKNAMRSVTLTLSCTVMFTLLCAPAGLAQELRVGAVQAWSDHDLLGSPRGLSVAVGTHLLDHFGIRVGFESYGDDFQSLGSTCVGLIPPNVDCSGELRREQARMRAVGLATPLSLVSIERLQLSLVPGLRTAWITSEQVGTESGRRRRAEKVMYGYEIGAEAVVPVSRLPLQFHVSGHVGALHPYQDETAEDGYTPFEQRFGFNRLQIGLSLIR